MGHENTIRRSNRKKNQRRRGESPGKTKRKIGTLRFIGQNQEYEEKLKRKEEGRRQLEEFLEAKDRQKEERKK